MVGVVRALKGKGRCRCTRIRVDRKENLKKVGGGRVGGGRTEEQDEEN